MLYQLGNSGHCDSYYRDVDCGNTANPTSGPDGDAATKGWDAATGWGEPDWFNFATGYAITLGATNLSQPAVAHDRHFAWTLREDAEQLDRARVLVPVGVDLLRGRRRLGRHAVVRQVPRRRRLGRGEHVLQDAPTAARRWFPSNSDMFSIACTSSSTCASRSAPAAASGGRPTAAPRGPTSRRRRQQQAAHADHVPEQLDLLRGRRPRQRDEVDRRRRRPGRGCTSTDGNPIYGLSCPSTTVCYATDIYAHVIKTADGGATWTWQTTPITTPGVDVAGLRRAEPVRRPDGDLVLRREHLRRPSGLYVVPGGQTIPSTDPPIVTHHRRRRDLDAPHEQRRQRRGLHDAVGRRGRRRHEREGRQRHQLHGRPDDGRRRRRGQPGDGDDHRRRHVGSRRHRRHVHPCARVRPCERRGGHDHERELAQLPARGLVPARHDDLHGGRPRRRDRDDDRPRDLDADDVRTRRTSSTASCA